MSLIYSLPDFIFHTVLVVGLLGLAFSFFLKNIPVYSIYRLPVYILSISLTALGLWFEGGIASQSDLKSKIEQLEKELVIAKKESNKVTKEIVTKLIVEKQIIREKGQTIKEFIDREVTVYDETCSLPKSVVIAHNAAALNNTSLLKNINVEAVIDIKMVNEAALPTSNSISKK